MNVKNNRLVLAFNDSGIADALAEALPILAQNFQLEIFARKELAGECLLKIFTLAEAEKLGIHIIEKVSVMQALKILRELGPLAVITGLSDGEKKVEDSGGRLVNDNKIDAVFLEAASREKIKTIAVLEEAYMSRKMIRARLNRHNAVADRLITTSDQMKAYLENFGWLPASNIVVAPMPKYKKALEVASNPQKAEQAEKLRHLNGISHEKLLVIFATSGAKEADGAALCCLNQAVESVADIEIRLIFHPEDHTHKEEYLALMPGARLLLGDGSDLEKVSCLVADNRSVLFSVKSSLLFDALLAGCRVASINPQQHNIYRGATAQLGWAPELVTVDEIKRRLLNLQKGIWRQNNIIPDLFRDQQAPQHFAEILKSLVGVER